MKKETEHVHLTGQSHGGYTLLLNGQDISRSVTGMNINIDAGRPAEITLHLMPGTIEADLQTDNINIEPNEGKP